MPPPAAASCQRRHHRHRHDSQHIIVVSLLPPLPLLLLPLPPSVSSLSLCCTMFCQEGEDRHVCCMTNVETSTTPDSAGWSLPKLCPPAPPSIIVLYKCVILVWSDVHSLIALPRKGVPKIIRLSLKGVAHMNVQIQKCGFLPPKMDNAIHICYKTKTWYQSITQEMLSHQAWINYFCMYV